MCVLLCKMCCKATAHKGYILQVETFIIDYFYAAKLICYRPANDQVSQCIKKVHIIQYSNVLGSINIFYFIFSVFKWFLFRVCLQKLLDAKLLIVSHDKYCTLCTCNKNYRIEYVSFSVCEYYNCLQCVYPYQSNAVKAGKVAQKCKRLHIMFAPKMKAASTMHNFGT